MYNEVTKDLFAAEMISTQSLRGIIRNFFDSSEKFEQKWNTDIAEFNDSQAKEFVKSVDIIHLGTIYQIRSLLMAYLKWCTNNQVFDNVSDSIVREFGTQLDVSEKASKILLEDSEELKNELEKVFDLRHGYHAPPILALAWIGIDKTTAYTIEDSCVDIESRKITYKKFSREINISEEPIYKILKEYADTDIGYRENKSTTYEVIRDESSERFIKNYYTKDTSRIIGDCTHAQLDAALNRCKEKYVALGNPNRLTYTNVWESGRLHELYTAEKAGLDVLSSDNRETIFDMFYKTKPVTRILFAYRNYKKAFNL